MTFSPQDFHFLRPEWFWALVPLFFAVWYVKHWQASATGWQGIIANHLYKYLVSPGKQKSTSLFIPLLALAWLLSVVALAGPTWERIPQPVYQVKAGHVVVMDMSLSMRATDLTPDRLSRAKYKAIDLVNLINEGDLGLVAYAGDAFIISPLTQDASTLKALLPSLSPEIMPVAGSDPLLGLKAAEELLNNAGFQHGMLYWVTDGVNIDQMKEISDFLAQTAFTVNILGVGTEQGAPIKQLNGELVKRSNGSIVVPKLTPGALQKLSRQSGGKYSSLTADDTDIQYLSQIDRFNNRETEDENSNNQGDEWHEAGPYLLFVLLPIAAFAFRRGLIFCLVVGVSVSVSTPRAIAQQAPVGEAISTSGSSTESHSIEWWRKPFMNADQRGLSAFEQQQYSSAATNFEHPDWKGAAQYRNGDYLEAADSYAKLDTAQGFYNQGNALAKAGQFDAAIAAYEKALERQPDFTEAAENRALIESLKDQQQQEQDNSEQQNSDDNQQSEQQQNPDQQSDQQEGQNQQDQNNSDQQDQQDQQQNSEGSQSDELNEQQEQESPSAEETPEEQKQREQEQQAQQAQEAESEQSKENQQRLNNLLRRVPDDPAFLLKRKMQLEAQKRQYNRPPAANRSDW